MRKVWIDFKQPISPTVRVLRALFFSIGLAGLCYSLYAYHLVDAERNALSWELQSLGRSDRQQSPLSHAGASPGQTVETLKPANDVLARLNLPWETIFSGLEKTLTPDVGLLSLQPDPGKAAITIKARAKDMTAAFDYLERLQATKRFVGAHLLSQDFLGDEEHLPLEFTLTANWVEHP